VWASARGLSIEPITGTYVHADFLRGDPALAAQTSAVISFGEGAGTEFPIETLYDGPRLSLGELTLEILAAPGLRAVTQGVAWHQMVLLQRRRHNVGEAGNPPHFLPERYAQEGG